jgi:3-methyladenine DNA glycosylase AlkC
MEERFSLKDFLFNKQKVEKIAQEIHTVYPAFQKNKFLQTTVDAFPHLELKQRIRWIADTLKNQLPDDFRTATTILIDALPPPNDNSKIDDDFGDFIYAPYADFVAQYGCTKDNLLFSLNALKQITMRFSVEDAIRSFLNSFPDVTLNELRRWSTDEHYHVRRLASEGTRPKLPWSQKIMIPIEKPIPILDNLFADTTRFVTRSVANHLNDISKIDPKLTVDTLTRWQQSGKQNQKEMEYIVKHALRTLLKTGDAHAIQFLQFSTDPNVRITHFSISDPVIMGEFVEFEFTVTANQDERLFIDYVLYFKNKAGDTKNKKVFKIKQLSIKKGQSVTIHKRHRLLKNMTTRKLYPGEHHIEIQINGKKLIKKEFYLKEA